MEGIVYTIYVDIVYVYLGVLQMQKSERFTIWRGWSSKKSSFVTSIISVTYDFIILKSEEFYCLTSSSTSFVHHSLLFHSLVCCLSTILPSLLALSVISHPPPLCRIDLNITFLGPSPLLSSFLHWLSLSPFHWSVAFTHILPSLNLFGPSRLLSSFHPFKKKHILFLFQATR
jgi:hypothetical protein